MTFTLTINCDNAAFEDGARFAETATILRKIADRLDLVRRHKDGYEYVDGRWVEHFQTIHDSNGNDVGRYAFKEEEEQS